MGALTNLVSLAGWTFLPGYVAGWIQFIYYGIVIRAGDPKPAPGSARYVEHRRRIQLACVSLYLAYCLYEEFHAISSEPNYYTVLGLPPGASDRDVKSRFRRLAALNHPDKAGLDAGGGGSDAYYIRLQQANEVLFDPTRRFLYERLGPNAVRDVVPATLSEQLWSGLLRDVLLVYVGTAATLYVIGLLGYMQHGRYYRWVGLVAIFVCHLYTITRPYMPSGLAWFNYFLGMAAGHPSLLQFEAMTFARDAFATVCVGFSQLGPLLKPATPRSRLANSNEKAALNEAILGLEKSAKAVEVETSRLWSMEMSPFVGDQEALQSLRGKMKEWLVQNTIRADVMVKDSVATALRKRRIEAPGQTEPGQ